MKKVWMAVTMAAGLSFGGTAMANDFSMAFENTLKVEDPNGTTLIYLNEDGTYTTDRDTSGKWSATETEFCFTPETQPAMCSPLLVTDNTFGESWTSTSSDGSSTATFTLIEGR